MGGGLQHTVRERRRPRALARMVALALCLTPLGGCSWLSDLWGTDKVNIPDDPADRLYNEGLFLLNNKKDYKAAAKRFEEVDRQHPYSEWARKALLMSALAHYEGRSYDDAIASARRYVTLNPASPAAAYAQYIIGSAMFEGAPDNRADKTPWPKALA